MHPSTKSLAPSGGNPIIEAYGLVKTYGDVVALDGLDLTVPEGTILGLLGPNGAGKTTAVSILTTLLQPDSGTATVAGADVVASPGQVRKRIGLSGQYAAVDEHLTGFENLDMIGRLYHLGKKRSRARARELLERFDLADAGDRPVKTYSGGMRRRLDLAGALVAEPPVLFLDEPTTGLDPRSRTELWAMIRDLVKRGTTLLLTTQYMEEADQLADDIIVIDHGREIAHGTADQLKTMVGGERIEVSLQSDANMEDAQRVLARFSVGDLHIEDRTVITPVSGGAQTLTEALRSLDSQGVKLRDVGLRRPTLDEVFLSLTGHVAEQRGEETSDNEQSKTPDGLCLSEQPAFGAKHHRCRRRPPGGSDPEDRHRSAEQRSAPLRGNQHRRQRRNRFRWGLDPGQRRRDRFRHESSDNRYGFGQHCRSSGEDWRSVDVEVATG